MSWIDWLIILAVIIILVIVIRIIQKITAVIATIIITLLLIAVAIYFLYQWDFTAPLLSSIIDQSTLGAFLRGVGSWLVTTILNYVN